MYKLFPMPHVYPKHNLAADAACPRIGGALKKLLFFIVFLPMFLLARAQAPDIQSFTPTHAGFGDTVTIKGIHLDSVFYVSFGGRAAGSFTIQSDSVITAIVGSTPGNGYVAVFSPTGSDSLGGFVYVLHSPPPPVVSAFSPSSGTTGTVVTITGAHLQTTTSVQFGGVGASSFSVLSDTMVRAVVGAGATGAVKVFTTGGFGVAADTFRYIASPPPVAPDITSFFPDSARTNDTVRIVGIHLDSVNAVSLGGVAARSFVVVSDSLIWAVVGTGASGYVRVSSARGTDSLGGFVFITPPPPPSFRLLSFTGTPGFSQRLTWQVLHDQSVSSYHVELSLDTATSPFSLLATVASRHLDSATYTYTSSPIRSGTFYYRLKIFSAAGDSTLSPVIALSTDTTTPPPVAPDITFFFPDSARTNDTVRIVGVRLDSVNAVGFGGVPAQSFTIVSDSLIVAVVGGGHSGQVKVSSAGGVDSLGGFTYIPATPPPPAGFQLLSFTGTPGNPQHLMWNTLHDQTVANYNVEISLDSARLPFSRLRTVASKKLDSASYSVSITPIRSGVFYYRLRIVDTAGNSTFSQTLAPSTTAVLGLSVYPNPVSSGAITVQVPQTTTSSRFLLTDASGHVVLTVPVSRGVRQMIIPVSRYNKGIYKLVWSDGHQTASQTILIM